MRYAWTVMSPWGLQVSKWEVLPEQVHSPKSILESEPSSPLPHHHHDHAWQVSLAAG